MKRNFRRIAVVLILCLVTAAAATAYADVTPLGLDMKIHGQPVREDGWTNYDKDLKEYMGYQDESITVEMTREYIVPKGSKGRVQIWIAVVEIKDPSQLRTTFSYESYENPELTKALNMAEMVNAVVAINDDYTKNNIYQGYVLRQGVFYQDTLSKLLKPQDVLIIDDQGDFSVVIKATTETVEAKTAELAENGRKPVNIITFGPTLVIDGVPQDCKWEDSIHETHLPAARTAIGQLGPLKYFMMVVHGKNSEGTGMSGNVLANYIVSKFPECKIAYNLDGGNSSKMTWRGHLRSESGGGRLKLSGMIYFASAATGE